MMGRARVAVVLRPVTQLEGDWCVCSTHRIANPALQLQLLSRWHCCEEATLSTEMCLQVA